MRRCLCDPTFSRFDTIPECDRHTHRHTTMAYTALSKASRGYNVVSYKIRVGIYEKVAKIQWWFRVLHALFAAKIVAKSHVFLLTVSIRYWFFVRQFTMLDKLINMHDFVDSRWFSQLSDMPFKRLHRLGSYSIACESIGSYRCTLIVYNATVVRSIANVTIEHY